MRRLRNILILTAVALTCASCDKDVYDQRLEIPNLQKTQIITLHKKPTQGNIYSIKIHGAGKLNGDARIMLMLNDAPYNMKQLNGTVNFKWGGDWYSDTAEIKYEPTQANSGSLIIEYKFYDLK